MSDRSFPTGKGNFRYTDDQTSALKTFAQFLYDEYPRCVMILRGSAGTGKTTLAAHIVKYLRTHHHKMVLLAPTGRAAKVFETYSSHSAFTIHRRIYRQKKAGEMFGAFSLAPNNYSNTLFMVDESSMIGDDGMGDSLFGTGRLLDDLISFVYDGNDCRLLLIGDTAQLPPVGKTESPALSSDIIETYDLKVYEADLNEVVRQASSSGILYNATRIRDMISRDAVTNLPKIRFKDFADVSMISGSELIDSISDSYYRVGTDETIVVTRSNKRANRYNQGIRNMILGREEGITGEDMLMIVKNNYFWTSEKDSPLSFLANGDRCVVQRVRNMRERYGFLFADVTIYLPDYDDYEITATTLLTTLTSEAPALTREQNETLYQAVMADFEGKRKPEKLRLLKENEYYNALQIKFAYAVTCHKAQGGQWEHVYIDQGYMTEEMLTPDYAHWLYTAITRAKTHVFFVNWNPNQTEK